MLCYQQLAKESGSALQHIPLGRHRDDYTLDDSEERAIKRPRLMESDHSQKESSETSNGRKVCLLNAYLKVLAEHVNLIFEGSLVLLTGVGSLPAHEC